jgi:integrase/recombinase XerC
MAASRRRLNLAERRMPMSVSVQPLEELQRQYLQQHEARGSTRSTIDRYRNTFRLFDRFLATSATIREEILSKDTMEAFAIWLRETPVPPRHGSTERSIDGIQAHMRDMRAWLNWLADERLIASKIKVPIPKLPERLFPILSDEEMDRLWRSKYLTGSSDQAIRNRALLALMLDTGLRRSEVASLTLDQTDTFNQMVTVIGKGNKQRRVPYSSSVNSLIQDWLTVRGPEPGTLFWLASESILTLFQRIQKDVGLERFHPHMLRHQAATMLVRANTDLATVKRILGHSDIATTLRYLSLSDDDIRAKHAQASPFDRIAAKLEPHTVRGRRKFRLS